MLLRSSRLVLAGLLFGGVAVDGQQTPSTEPGISEAPLETIRACIEKLEAKPPGVHLPCRFRGNAMMTAGVIGRLSSFYAHDGTAGVFVRDRNPSSVKRGDSLEVRGKIYIDRNSEYEIRAERVTRLGGGPEPNPSDAAASDIQSGAHQGELVRTRGVVVESSVSPRLVVFYLGNRRLRVYWRPATNAETVAAFPEVERESLVEVTGISRPSRLGDGSYRHQIRMRTPQDLSVLQGAPMLNSQQWKTALAAMAGIAGIGFAWVFTLRRKVEAKTRQVRGARDNLETRVQQRTTELREANRALHSEITERKQAEQQQKKLAALVEHSSDFIGMASVEEKVFYVNPAGRRMVGQNGSAEREGETIADYHPEATYVELRETTFLGGLAGA